MATAKLGDGAAAEHNWQIGNSVGNLPALTVYQKTWQDFLIYLGQNICNAIEATNSIGSGFNGAITAKLQVVLDNLIRRILPELQWRWEESAADRHPEAIKLLQQHGFADYGSMQSWVRQGRMPICPLLLRPMADGSAADRGVTGLAGYYAEHGARDLPTLYVPRLALHLLLGAKPAAQRTWTRLLRFGLWTLSRGYLGLLLKGHSAAYFCAKGRRTYDPAAFAPKPSPAAAASGAHHPEASGLPVLPAWPGISVREAYTHPRAEMTVSAYDLLRLMDSLLASAGPEAGQAGTDRLNPAWMALQAWQAQGAEPGLESWLTALEQSPAMPADCRSKWLLGIIQDSLTLPENLGQSLRQDAAAFLISSRKPSPPAVYQAGDRLPPKIRLLHLPKTFACWRSDLEAALRQMAAAGAWKQRAGVWHLLLAADQALAAAENLPAGGTTVLIPELAAKLWPAIAGLAGGEKPSACDFGPDLGNHKFGFTTGTMSWVDAKGAALAVRQVGEMIYAERQIQSGEQESQSLRITAYDGRMPKMVRLEGWRKMAVHLWLIGIDALPVRLEKRLRTFWRQQSPGGYLSALLDQDPSLLAKTMLQEPSPLAQAYYRWVLDHGPGSGESFLRSLARSLCRQEDDALRGSLLTLQRLAGDLPGLEPVELRLARRPLSFGPKFVLCLPGGLLQPGLDGPLRYLLRRCREAGVEVEGAALEGQRRRQYSYRQGD